MRTKPRRTKEKYWHKWFAWHPVKINTNKENSLIEIDQYWIWLEYVERSSYFYDGPFCSYILRTLYREI